MCLCEVEPDVLFLAFRRLFQGIYFCHVELMLNRRNYCGIEITGRLALLACVQLGAGDAAEFGKSRIRFGDRVMQVKNCYDRGIVNGSIGVVLSVSKTEVFVRFERCEQRDARDSIMRAYFSSFKSRMSTVHETICVGLPLSISSNPIRLFPNHFSYIHLTHTRIHSPEGAKECRYTPGEARKFLSLAYAASVHKVRRRLLVLAVCVIACR